MKQFCTRHGVLRNTERAESRDSLATGLAGVELPAPEPEWGEACQAQPNHPNPPCPANKSLSPLLADLWACEVTAETAAVHGCAAGARHAARACASLGCTQLDVVEPDNPEIWHAGRV